MGVFYANNLESLVEFVHQPHQLTILKREAPKGAEDFFKKFATHTLGVAGEVHKASALEDIRHILEDQVPADIKTDPLYEVWLNDMARISASFCDVEHDDSISFWVGSRRGCRRYHVDNVPRRLLVTYAGQGTEWLPDDAADRTAFAEGEPNEKIITDATAKQFIGQWDVALFRGGSDGLLHRTPDEALNQFSILMRLDNKVFWEKILKPQSENGRTAS